MIPASQPELISFSCNIPFANPVNCVTPSTDVSTATICNSDRQLLRLMLVIVHAEVAVSCLQEVTIRHDAIFNTRLLTGRNEIVANTFRRSKARSGVCDLHHETRSTNFLVIHAHLCEWL